MKSTGLIGHIKFLPWETRLQCDKSLPLCEGCGLRDMGVGTTIRTSSIWLSETIQCSILHVLWGDGSEVVRDWTVCYVPCKSVCDQDQGWIEQSKSFLRSDQGIMQGSLQTAKKKKNQRIKKYGYSLTFVPLKIKWSSTGQKFWSWSQTLQRATYKTWPKFKVTGFNLCVTFNCACARTILYELWIDAISDVEYLFLSQK